MIAFGSQRGNGADLATHLSNAEDNEYVEFETRGTLCDDLHGAFSEIEAKAKAMTKLERYLYSLSINPDPNQPWSRDMYDDYLARAEKTLGLEGQDRAIVFHIKEGADKELREHCHAVWSRVDVQNSRGINISYDRLKLMQLAREFAQDYGLKLPQGYYEVERNHEQTSLYESVKQAETGLSKKDHKEHVTDLWRTSDSPKAFVAALEDTGYMLATGRRPYVLVDSFGKMHALPRLIDDKSVRSKDVEAFLRHDFPTESLSTVAEAQAVAKQLEQSRERMAFSQKLEEQREILARDQDQRREALQQEINVVKATQLANDRRLADQTRDRLYAHALNVAQDNMEVQFKRAANAPHGLAGFLSRITGMDAVRRKLHTYQDKKRALADRQMREAIEAKNAALKAEQDHKHRLEMMEISRREAAQQKAFERGQRSVEMAQQRERVAFHSRGHEHMPSVHLALKPPGRKAVSAKATRRLYAPTVKEDNVKQGNIG